MDTDPNVTAKTFDDAEKAVSQADAVVVIGGIDVTQEAEGLDRTSVRLPGNQNNFTHLMCAAAARKGIPCVVLIMSGSAVDTEEIENDPNVSALMWVGYPGERGGEAIANAVFGMKDSFGKMPFSVYKAAYYEKGMPHNALSPLDFSMRPNASSNNPGRTYRFYDGPEMLHSFGTGLQYNTWHLDTVSCAPVVTSSPAAGLGSLSGTGTGALFSTSTGASSVPGSLASACTLSLAGLEGKTGAIIDTKDTEGTSGATATGNMITPALRVSVRAWHTGAFERSSVVVMVFAVPPPATTHESNAHGRPLRTLVGFERVEMEASSDDGDGGLLVEFTLPKRAFLLAGATGSWDEAPGGWSLEFEAGPSRHGASLDVQVVA
jgi:hypothetical protein